MGWWCTITPVRQGTWRLVDGKWVPIERSSVTFDTETYVTVVLATSYIDWTNWQLSSIPGLGTLSLETFGASRAHGLHFAKWSLTNQSRPTFWKRIWSL